MQRLDDDQMMNNEDAMVTMYSTSWCGGCHRAKMYLKSWGIDFKEINIEQTPGAAEQVMAWANGKRVVPTFAVGDRVLVNPGMQDLARAVGAEY
jgi:mycoredoxin